MIKSDTNLYILDMHRAGHTSGVDRYLETFVKGISSYDNIRLAWISLTGDGEMIFSREKRIGHCVKLSVPLPQRGWIIAREPHWNRRYNERLYGMVKHLFEGKKNVILHLHTINLIDFALFVREKTGCRTEYAEREREAFVRGAVSFSAYGEKDCRPV